MLLVSWTWVEEPRHRSHFVSCLEAARYRARLRAFGMSSLGETSRWLSGAGVSGHSKE